jgi:hypothetical protein
MQSYVYFKGKLSGAHIECTRNYPLDLVEEDLFFPSTYIPYDVPSLVTLNKKTSFMVIISSVVLS